MNLGYTDIASPVDGTVVSRNVTRGQTVAATFQTPTLFLIASDLTKMQVDTNVSESDIGNIKDGNAANFTVDAYPDRVFRGTVTQVRQSPQTVQNVVTYDVVVSVANPDLALRPGMTAAVQIVTAQRTNVLRVPDPAFRYRATATPDRPAGAPGEAADLGAAQRQARAGPCHARPGRRQQHRDRQRRPPHRRPGDHRRAARYRRPRRRAKAADVSRGMPCPPPSSRSRTSPAPSTSATWTCTRWPASA